MSLSSLFVKVFGEARIFALTSLFAMLFAGSSILFRQAATDLEWFRQKK